MKNAVCFYRTVMYGSYSPGAAILLHADIGNISKPPLCNHIVRPEMRVPEKKLSALQLKRSWFFSKHAAFKPC